VWLVFACRKAGPLQSSAAIGTGSLLAAPYALGYDLAVILPFLAYATFRGSFGAAFALSGTLNPAPLLLTTWQLLRGQGSTGNPVPDGELAHEPGGSPTKESA
jgi:hypothetical protein